MPLCSLNIISLYPKTSIPSFLSSLRTASINPIIQSRTVRWVILPKELSTVPLLAHNVHWDLLLVLPADTVLPSSIKSQIGSIWTVIAGVPSRLLKDFPSKNAALVNPSSGTVKPPDTSNALVSDSSQSLELSPELSKWISDLPARPRSHAISMLNLLAFNPGRKEQYLKYGAEFGSKVGARHGGNAKIVGTVASGQGKEEGWDEIAIAHYPSLEQFAAMLGSKDYQEVNHKFRLGALKDTCILCTMEIGDDGELIGGREEARL
ncbi:hypothetical protein EJ08DRAFT_647286 [Tothia fuscella]|uniref:DUF1330 domain-containing protein n=1 Tax=Tothia fuscella TaxID=1048955 RepID=A0A9P4U1L4_9PEZI|nr:hypothetical protein EJ08DRAFT_647286 [Tothia fuscella]